MLLVTVAHTHFSWALEVSIPRKFMSLTSILNYSNKSFKDLRELLTSNFHTPKFRKSEPRIAEPISSNPTLIGTAFDYLLRFHLEKHYQNNVYGRKWVAESAIDKYFKQDRIRIHPQLASV